MSLEFGTAGIRGIVGSGINNLNEAYAAQIFHAYAEYIYNEFSHIKNKEIVIGRDNRIKGKKFCKIAVNILTSYGIKVYFNDKMLPTPFISFLIKQKKALGGINITASHNPKEYNGIKLYNKFGFQMLPDEILKIKKYFLDYEKYREYIDKEISLNNSNNIIDIIKDDYLLYINKVLSIWNGKKMPNLKVVYSSLHGTGYEFLKEIFEKLNVNVIYEENEIIEDEDFSYVSNPNPEYLEAYKNSINLANKHDADIIIITDPDSDRIGVAYRDYDKQFKLINGNENAILIVDYLLKNKNIDINKKNYMVHSFVSTSLPNKMCSENNIKSYITETGFKWIGDLIEKKKLEEEFFFAFEESYGSLVDSDISLDKDAIQSVLLMLLIANDANLENINLKDKLNKIYKKYGYMTSQSFSYDLKNINQLNNLKDKFKKIDFPNSKLLDYSKGIRGIQPNDMLCFEFDNTWNWVSLRPSGTEPKFKIYIHVIDKTYEGSKKIFDEIFEKIKDSLNL